ncbi:hypothetical protein MMC13_005854 [Lambiella insularis]|nr:hypothetical protein [Lambiella insularis]
MAPILISHEQQYEITAPVVQPKRRLKPFVPVVPRSFERKQNRSLPTTPTSSSVIHAPIDDGLDKPENQIQQPLFIAGEHVSVTPIGTATDRSDRASETSQHFENVHYPDIDSQPTYSEIPYSSVPPNTFQLPSALYPTTARSQPHTYPTYSFPATHPTNFPTLLSPYTFDRTIVFGGEPDSNQSSPISLPSASSTAFTQPTPLSDAASYQSQSLYQGYGHLPSAYGRYVPSKLACEPRETLESEPVLLSHTSHYDKPPAGSSIPYQPPSSPPNIPLSSETNNSYAHDLSTYLLDQFDNPTYADCVLDVVYGSQRTTLMVHAVLVAQSPTVRGFLGPSGDLDEKGRKKICLTSTASFLTTPSITSALQSCYGKLLTRGSESGDDLYTALALFSAGRLLQLSNVVEVATASALHHLTLENVELALHCALCSEPLVPRKTQVDNSEQLPMAEQKLISGIINFLLLCLPPNFVFDASAPSAVELGGFPLVTLSKAAQSVVNPLLLSIRFGDFPSENNSKPSAESVAISRILLSIPFELLERFLSGLDPSTRIEITRSIIEERERRRHDILDNGLESVGQPDLAEDVLEKLGWEEQVVGDDLSMVIRRVGIKDTK